MARIIDSKQLILHCMKVNCDYMRLPAGMLQDYQAIASLYQRLAIQGKQCAEAWVKDNPCPEHEPALDAFFWGVVSWADAFGLSMGLDQVDWNRVFVVPHHEFACYLRPDGLPEPLPIVSGPAADIIMRLDALWMERVVKLTAKWGLLHYLNNTPALLEVRLLAAELRRQDSPIRRAYLESDLAFFKALFKPFPFTKKTRSHIELWLKEAETLRMDINNEGVNRGG